MRTIYPFWLKNVAEKQLAVLRKLGMELEAERLSRTEHIRLQVVHQICLLHIRVGRKRKKFTAQLEHEKPVQCFVKPNFNRLLKLEILECSFCHQ